jgi:phosphoglycerate dehydrogenase-like enzyme
MSALRVAVPAISFGQHAGLVKRLLELYPDAKVNTEGIPYYRSEQETIAYLDGFDAAIVSFEPINERVLAALPRLKVISKLGVGLDKIDAHAMRRHGVRLGWTPGVNKRSVAELALCLAIAALRHVVELNASMRRAERPLQKMGRHLTGRVVGVHGCGEIGKEFVRLLEPFGCTVLACDIKDYAEFYARHRVTPVGLEELLARSEVLSIHLTVTNRTHGLYDAATLDKLRPDCVLINTARGRIVDEAALKERLKSRRIAAAAIDAFAIEPPTDDELLNLPNFIATPHVGAGAEEARWLMGTTAIDGLVDNFLPEPGVLPFEDR